MAEANVRVNLDGLGKKIRTEELTVGADLVEQQVVTLADSAGNLLDTQLSNLNLSLTALRDSITAAGAAAKTLADVVTAISGTLKDNLTQVSGVTLNGQVPVNTPPLFGSDVLGLPVLGAHAVTGTVAVTGQTAVNLTQISGATLTQQMPVNDAPLFGTQALGDGVLGAAPITNATLTKELFRTRFALQLILAQLGMAVDLTALQGTEGI